MTEKQTDKLTVTLPYELVKKIKIEAVHRDSNVSELVRLAITEYLGVALPST